MLSLFVLALVTAVSGSLVPRSQVSMRLGTASKLSHSPIRTKNHKEVMEIVNQEFRLPLYASSSHVATLTQVGRTRIPNDMSSPSWSIDGAGPATGDTGEPSLTLKQVAMSESMSMFVAILERSWRTRSWKLSQPGRASEQDWARFVDHPPPEHLTRVRVREWTGIHHIQVMDPSILLI